MSIAPSMHSASHSSLPAFPGESTCNAGMCGHESAWVYRCVPMPPIENSPLGTMRTPGEYAAPDLR